MKHDSKSQCLDLMVITNLRSNPKNHEFREGLVSLTLTLGHNSTKITLSIAVPRHNTVVNLSNNDITCNTNIMEYNVILFCHNLWKLKQS